MHDTCLRTPLAGVLLCLLMSGGCDQPPGSASELEQRQEPAVPARPPAMSAPAPADPAAAPAVPPEPAGQVPDLKSLILTPAETPFADTGRHPFGEVRDADWLAASPPRSAPDRLLPDLFEDAANQGRLNVEGELLLDGSQETTRMVDGVGMKLKINTD